MRVLIAGGGTGGHVYPAVAILEGLRRREADVKVGYVGTRRGLEARVLASYPSVDFYPIHARGFARKGRWSVISVLFWLAVALLESLIILVRFRPHLVVGVGGYSSFAPVAVASTLGRVFSVRTAVHEQNAVAGLSNRILSRFVDVVMISYREAKRSFPHARKIVLTGNPVREEFLHACRTTATYTEFGLDPRRHTVLMFGGSNGSAELVEEVLRSKDLVAHSDGTQILLVTGKSVDATEVQRELASVGAKNVVAVSYIEKMGAAFAVADLIVSRAGATTLAEITTCGKASLLVPWRDAADNHQWENARILEQEDACRLADEGSIVHRQLVNLVLDLVKDEATLHRLAGNARRLGQRQADALIVGEIRSLVRGARA